MGHTSPSPQDILLLFLLASLVLLAPLLSGHLNNGCLVLAAPYKLLVFPTKMLGWLASCHAVTPCAGAPPGLLMERNYRSLPQTNPRSAFVVRLFLGSLQQATRPCQVSHTLHQASSCSTVLSCWAPPHASLATKQP